MSVRGFLRRFFTWIGDHRYLILVSLVAIALALSGWSSYTSRDAGEKAQATSDANTVVLEKLDTSTADISDLQAVVRELRKEQRASCINYTTLRDAVNLFHGTLDKLLLTAQRARAAAYERSHQQSDKDAVTAYKQLRAGLRQVTKACAQRTATSSRNR